MTGRPETLHELRKWGTAELSRGGIEEADTDAMALFCRAFSMTKAQYIARSRERLTETEAAAEAQFREWIRRRKAREPLQYILGEAYFFGYSFYVTPDVLIPRFDSETLVAEALSHVSPGMRILDLCTGSGCLLLSVLLEKEGLSGTGCDISDKAVRVAAENAARLGVKDVTWYTGDLFGALPEGTAPYDLILSNPPYISSGEIPGLMPEVVLHEPHTALDGGPDGLHFYRRILREADPYLAENGWLIFECGFDETDALLDMMEESGYADCLMIKDMGGLPRVVRGRKQYGK